MNFKKIKFLIFAFSFLVFAGFLISTVLAGTNISSGIYEHWAWNDVIGWIDFYNTPYNVNVYNDRLEGYASSSVGYIALNCNSTPNGNICGSSNFKVSNDPVTGLSGWAWNDAIGWISFYCDHTNDGTLPPNNVNTCVSSNYQVIINPDGDFQGFAWNDIVGWISFNKKNCDADNNGFIDVTCGGDNTTIVAIDYKVKTSWSATAATGTLLSSIFDTGVADGAAFNSIMWKGSQPAGTAVKFQFASVNQLQGGSVGPIDNIHRYAWNDSTGWWDFGYPAGNVSVSSTQLTGYAYNSNLKEISLDCATSPIGDICSSSNYKVNRDPETGDLSGWAWNDVIGWISFSGVTVNPTTGIFTGYAWNDDVGWISFNCADPGVCDSSDYYVATELGIFPEPIGPDGTVGTYYSTAANTPISFIRANHNNHRYFLYKIILESDSSQTLSPRVDDVLVNWSP